MSSEDRNPTSKPKPFSISLSSTSQKKKLYPSSSTLPNKSANGPSSKTTAESLPRRPRTFQDHDSDNEDSNHRGPVVEEVTGFDREAGGAISAHRRAEQEKKPLVIKVDSKNNWQERPWQRKRKGLNLLPAEVRAQREAEASGVASADATREAEEPTMKFGLSLAEKSDGEGGEGDVNMADAGSVEKERDKEDKPLDGEEQVPQKPMTQDEIAMQALIRESTGDGGEPTRRSDLVISGKRKERDEDEYGAEGERFDETKSFRADVASRPEPASLAAYSAIPVEEFGAALLRGMGWKDGEPIGRGKYGNSNAKSTKVRTSERRPGYLGIGAKELPGNKSGSGSEVELGAWGKSAMRKAKKPGEGLYTPVLMRNKKTGEMVTQDEFNRLVKERGSEGAKKDGEDSWHERRDRNLQLNGRDRDRDRRSEKDDDGSSESDDGYKSRRNGRGTSGDRDNARDRRKRYTDREADTTDSGLDDRYHGARRSDRGDRDRASGRDRDRDRDRKYRSNRKSYDDDDDYDGDYRSRPSSSASRRDRSAGRDSRRDRDRASARDRRDRYDRDRDDSRKGRSRREEVY